MIVYKPDGKVMPYNIPCSFDIIYTDGKRHLEQNRHRCYSGSWWNRVRGHGLELLGSEYRD